MFKEEIVTVVEDQRKNLSLGKKNVQRENLNAITPTVSFAKVISGIRRCGKSTLLKQALSAEKNYYYLNLEDLRLSKFELDDFLKLDEIFVEKYGKKGAYFFDEVQTVKNWEKFVRSLVDKGKKVILTGSNASLLSRELGSLLTGRHLGYELFPFSFKEFLTYKNKKASLNSFEEYFKKGGLPEYLEKENIEILQELVKDVIMRDIAVRFNIKNSELLKNLAIYLTSNVGKEYSYNSLKKMFSVPSIQTIIDYISFFENAYLIFSVPRFSYSYKKQQLNPKKVYSIDNALTLSNSVSFSKDDGRLLENIVFLHLRRKYKEIFYFNNGKSECDFLIKEKNKIVGIYQVCFDLTKDAMDREINGLVDALKEFKLNNGFILTNSQEDELQRNGKKIKIMPVWKWLLEG